LPDHLFGLVLVVPEVGFAHAGGETIALGDLAGNVKESPGDGPSGWSNRRFGVANRHSFEEFLKKKPAGESLPAPGG
jgi:hypothetical protein